MYFCNMKLNVKSLAGLPEAATQFIAANAPGKIYAFDAPMGAGKTTFIAEICRQLSSDVEANSPTFSIVNEYDTPEWGKIFHLDCYRLENEEEAYDIGVEDYFNSGATCLVEWPERIESLLPDDTVWVSITPDSDGQRTIEWK